MSCTGKRNWKSKIRTDHPRLFINKETWTKVKAYTLEHQADIYEKMKQQVAEMPAEADNQDFPKGSNPKYGPYAQMCAFIWLMEKDKSALAKAKNYIREGVKWYHKRLDNGNAVNWYSCSRVCALTAYDWIYNELTPEERKEFAQGMLDHYQKAMGKGRFRRQNRSGITSGFYGVSNMPWYLGLVFHKDGINDELADKFITEGHKIHIELLKYRGKVAGDDGGTGSQSLGYGLGFYPFTEFNFMHTMESATGISLAEEYPHLSLFPLWVYWNFIPGGKSFGLADAHHLDNGFSQTFIPIHFLNIAHFFADQYPERAQFAMWVKDSLITHREVDNYWWPCLPFFLHRGGNLPAPKGPDKTWALGRNFKDMGLVFMRSGWGEDETHAVFVSNGKVASHRHYDEGHFVIYKKGFLALDTGTYGDRNRSPHLTEYSNRTVAHNSILIHAKKDTKPKIWGGPAGTDDGGQYQHDAKTVAYETNDKFTYTANDMTKSYDQGKAEQVVRQFLFVHPDIFLVFDRVISKKAGDKKKWLLHTARKPMLAGNTFSCDQAEGRLFCRTLLPEDATFELVGGKGKEYWSAGKNWKAQGALGDTELLGKWRVEVSPGEARKEDIYFHIIKVGDAATLDGMGLMEEVADSNKAGVSFEGEDGKVEVVFNTTGLIGGTIKFGEQPPQALTAKVQPQSELSGYGKEL